MAELSTSGRIPAQTVADAAAGDSLAFARIVRAHHDDMARVCQVICDDPDSPRMRRERGRSSGGSSGHCAIPRSSARGSSALRRTKPVSSCAAFIAIASFRSISPTFDPRPWTRGRNRPTTLSTTAIRLPTEDRMLIALRYVAGFDATEIGRTMGLSASGVQGRLAPRRTTP